MNTMVRRPCICLIATALCVQARPSIGQERVKPPGQKEITQLVELANPGPEHEMLAKFAGNWEVAVTSGRAGGRADSIGRGRSYMAMEQRSLWIGYEAKGQSGRFKGTFTIGFDRRHQHFTLIAMDTDGNYFITSKGKPVPESEAIKLFGTDDDPWL